MLCLAQGCIGICIMGVITLVAMIASIYFAGRIAERRGRSFKNWAWVAGLLLGPLALPLLFVMPNLHRKNGDPA
jgi:hypothetical protein